MSTDVGALLRPWIDTEREYAFVLLSEPRGAALVARVAWGEAHRVAVPIVDVLRVPLTLGARSFAFAHSHPGGWLRVTPEDVELTRLIRDAAQTTGLVLRDHYIVTPQGGCLSLVESGYLAAPLTAEGPQEYTRRIAAERHDTP